MKKFLLTLSAIFMCIGAHAKTETINWYMDGNTYATTQCETGSDIILPQTPYKYGYTFNGWASFTPIEYLESTGTQWIDTGVRGNMNYTYQIDFQQTDNNPYRNWGVFETSAWGGPNMSSTYCGASNNFCIRFGINGMNQLDLPQTDTNRHIIKISKGSVYWDGVYKGYSPGYQDGLIFAYNPFLGTINPGGTTPVTNAHSKYYSYRVWNTNDVLIQDFIPVLDSNNVPCMFDKVEKKFYYNAGTGQFIAGPVITE